jgi:pimeloyl-ACP methyl ester carboxylesterase
VTRPPARWLVLPGLACPPESFDAVRDLLRARGTDLVLDVRDAWRAPVLAADAERVLDGQTYDGVVGHSLGGLLALEIALLRPDRVGRVVLLDPTPPWEQGPPAAVRDVLHRTVPALVALADALGLLALVDRVLGRRRRVDGFRPGLFRDARTWVRLWAELEVGWDRAGRVAADLAAPARRHHPDLLVPVPVTASARRSQHRVVGSGHLVMCDRPDAVVDALIARPPWGTGSTRD